MDYSGDIVFYQAGLVSRPIAEGPAVVTPDGRQEYWLDGVCYEVVESDGSSVTYPLGRKAWYEKIAEKAQCDPGYISADVIDGVCYRKVTS